MRMRACSDKVIMVYGVERRRNGKFVYGERSMERRCRVLESMVALSASLPLMTDVGDVRRCTRRVNVWELYSCYVLDMGLRCRVYY